MSGATAVLALGGTLPPPVGMICGALAPSAGACAWIASRYEDDPPDFDFTNPVTPPRSIVNVDLIEEKFDPGGGRELLASLNGSYAFLAATLAAYERLQGAAIAGDRYAQNARFREADDYRQQAARFVETLGRSFPNFAELTFMRYESRLEWTDRPIRINDFPDSTLAFLFRIGVRADDLTRALLVSAEVESVEKLLSPRTFFDAARYSPEFAMALQEWEPRP